jgi:hypothetical protein
MTYTLAVILSFSIAIAAVIGWVRFSKINPTYYPFLFCIWIGFLNEIVGYLITKEGYSNAVNNNIYVLFESLLLTWQFDNWKLFKGPRYLFVLLLCLFTFTWVMEGFFIKGITHTISYFRILYSFVIVLMSISIMNEQLLRERRNFLKNSIFLICLGSVIYYTNKVIIGMFWLYGLKMSIPFMVSLVWIMVFINLFTNLIFALAILWMPTKHRFSLPS